MSVDLMIVGAAKSGTSSLLSYLGRHPQIQPQNQLEMTWFSDPELHARPFPTDVYFGAGPPDGRLRLGKAAGLMYREETIARLHALNPAVQAIAILREPVARAHSAFWFARQRGREHRDRFEDAVHSAGEGEYFEVLGSHYAPYVELLHDILGRASVHVVILEEFVVEPRRALSSLAATCDLDPGGFGEHVPRENSGGALRSPRLVRARRSTGFAGLARRAFGPVARRTLRQAYRRVNERGGSAPPMDPGIEAELRAYFDEPNRRLEELLGRPIDAWPRPGDTG